MNTRILKLVLICCLVISPLIVATSMASCSTKSDSGERKLYQLDRFPARLAIVRHDGHEYVFREADCTNFKLWISSCVASDFSGNDAEYAWDYQIVFTDVGIDECCENEKGICLPYTADIHYVNIDRSENLIQYDNQLYRVVFADPASAEDFYKGIDVYLNSIE